MYCSGVVIRVEDFKYAWVEQELFVGLLDYIDLDIDGSFA
jgi:hypothetical protein